MFKKKEKNIENAQEIDPAEETLQLIVFRLGKEEYGVHIDQVKEVIQTPNITKMPQTPEYIKGVTNIRGSVIGIVDLEEKFGIKEVVPTAEVNKRSNYTLVIESDEFKAGVLAKEIPNTLTVKSSDIEQSVNIVHDNALGDHIQGIAKLDGRLIIMIDVFKVIIEEEQETTSS